MTDREMLLAFGAKVLNYREREVLKLRLGVPDEERTYTQDECRRIFKVSIGRIRSIETKGLAKLRKAATRAVP